MKLMTASEAVDLAIQSERAAGRYFQVAAERADDARIRALLVGLAVVEQSRSIDLEALREVLIGGASLVHRQLYLEHLPPSWSHAETYTLEETVHVALRMERQSSLFYDSLAAMMPQPGQHFLRLMARAKECNADMVEHTVSELEKRRRRVVGLHQVLRNAIQAEHACGWIYKGLVGRCSEPRGRLFLEAMVRFEASHAEELERLMKTTRDAMPEAEGVVVVMSKTPPLFQMPATIDYEQALRIAMEAEARAARYYDALSRLFGGSARELLRTLARHERAHEEAIRQSLGLAPQARGPLAMTG